MRFFLDNRDDSSRRRTRVRAACPAIMILLMLGLAACASFKSYKLESRPLAHRIVIDGRDDDWRGNLYINAQSQYSLGFVNDDRDLYVCLLVTDPYKRTQILRGGLILWLDPKGGQSKRFGINFPLASKTGEFGPSPEGRVEGLPQVPPEDESAPALPSDTWTEFGIITANSEMPLVIKSQEGTGLEMKASAPAGLFVCEFKIPLQRSEKNPWAVGSQPGQTVSVGFETGKPPARRMDRRGGYGGYGGRGGYPGGYSRGGTGGDFERGASGRGIQIPEDLRVWAIVKLR